VEDGIDAVACLSQRGQVTQIGGDHPAEAGEFGLLAARREAHCQIVALVAVLAKI
jgi:hypothetical protein